MSRTHVPPERASDCATSDPRAGFCLGATAAGSGEKVSIDYLVLNMMRRIKPLLGTSLGRARLAGEVSASLRELGLAHCSVWSFQDGVARQLYLFDRSGAADGASPQPLGQEENDWLLHCAGQTAITTCTEAGRIRCAVPMSPTDDDAQARLMVLEWRPSDPGPLNEQSAHALQFMSNCLCSLFCYAGD